MFSPDFLKETKTLHSPVPLPRVGVMAATSPEESKGIEKDDNYTTLKI